MNSSEVKTKTLHYWRFIRKDYNFIATEVGRFNSDVLVANNKEIIACEIKVSKYDLKNDLKKKKHSIYKKLNKYYFKWIPNKFYFAVPSNLISYAKEIVENTEYGILEVLDKNIVSNKKVSYCKIVKKAKKLHKEYNLALHKQIILRESSELIRLRIKNLS